MKKIIHFILKYKVTLFLLIFYVGLTLKVYNGISLKGISLSTFTYSLANGITIILLLNILSSLWYKKNRVLKVLSYILYTIISIVLAFDIFFIFNYNNLINLGIFSSILETNIVEAKSMLSQYYLVILISIFLSFFLNKITIKELKKSKINIKISLILILFFIISMPSFYVYKFTDFKGKNSPRYRQIMIYLKEQPLLTIQNFYSNTFPFILNDIFVICFYINENNKIKNFSSRNKVIPENITHSKIKDENPKKIYVVIGETGYRKHFSLYGYYINNTPFLDSLAQQKNTPLSYFEAISPASITRDAIKLSLTFATPHNTDAAFKKKSIIDLAKHLDYETTWISNQSKYGFNENFITLLAASNDNLQYISDDMNADDLELLEELYSFYNREKKQLIFLHTRGSHIPYKNGYDKHDIMDIENQESKDYDRTILHTDKFLKQLHTFIKSKNESSILFYFSDHGELINIGHGFNKGEQQFEIPLLTIKYNTEINTDSIIKTYINKETKLINSLSTSHILSEFMGYKISPILKKEVIEEGNYIFNCNSGVTLFNDVQPFEGSIK